MWFVYVNSFSIFYCCDEFAIYIFAIYCIEFITFITITKPTTLRRHNILYFLNLSLSIPPKLLIPQHLIFYRQQIPIKRYLLLPQTWQLPPILIHYLLIPQIVRQLIQWLVDCLHRVWIVMGRLWDQLGYRCAIWLLMLLWIYCWVIISFGLLLLIVLLLDIVKHILWLSLLVILSVLLLLYLLLIYTQLFIISSLLLWHYSLLAFFLAIFLLLTFLYI